MSRAPWIAFTDFSIAPHSRPISAAATEFGFVFFRALAFRQRQHEVRPLRDLAAPHRNIQAEQSFTGMRHHRRLGVLPPRRRAVDDDRVGLAHLPGEIDGVLHGVEIEHARPARNDDQCRRTDRFGDARRHIRRGVDEGPFDAVAPCRPHDIADAAQRDFERQIIRLRVPGLAQLVPERQRSLWIGIDQETRPRRSVGVRGNMRRKRTLTRTTLTGSKNNDIHASSPSLAIRQIVLVLLIPKVADARRYPMPTSEST